MKTAIHILALLILTTTFSFGQKQAVPKNIQQAIKFLNKDCSDSLKQIIKNTDDKKIIKLSYPWGGNYETIYNWTSEENENSKIVQYLKSKGISSHQTEVILIAFKQFLLGQALDENAIYKPFQEIEKKWAQEDKVRFTTDSLRGVYIPKDLEDCFKQINSFWPDSTKLKVKNLPESEFSSDAHFGLGMWMRNNWQLWGGSRLSKYFNEMGIDHPDDISGIILDSYHRKLNDKELKLEEQVKHYIAHWESAELREKERTLKEFSAFKLGDTVLYNYNMGYVNEKQEQKDYDGLCVAKAIVKEIYNQKFYIRVKVIETCDRRGIIYYDSDKYKTWNEKTKEFEREKKRVIKRVKEGKERWFYYYDWKVVE